MARKTDLNRKMIQHIAELRKKHGSWNRIARAVGVDESTLRKWRRKGETQTRGIYHELKVAVGRAEDEAYFEYVDVIQNAATHPRTTVTTKEKVFVDGSVQKETIVKTQPPDHALAERNAERMEAEFWARQQQLNVLWREDIQSKGVDPDKLEKDLIERLENMDSTEGGA